MTITMSGCQLKFILYTCYNVGTDCSLIAMPGSHFLLRSRSSYRYVIHTVETLLGRRRLHAPFPVAREKFLELIYHLLLALHQSSRSIPVSKEFRPIASRAHYFPMYLNRPLRMW
jgi:hypothetical protein